MQSDHFIVVSQKHLQALDRPAIHHAGALLLAVIDGYTANSVYGGLYGSNKYLSDMLRLSERRIRGLLQQLQKEGLIGVDRYCEDGVVRRRLHTESAAG